MGGWGAAAAKLRAWVNLNKSDRQFPRCGRERSQGSREGIPPKPTLRGRGTLKETFGRHPQESMKSRKGALKATGYFLKSMLVVA